MWQIYIEWNSLLVNSNSKLSKVIKWTSKATNRLNKQQRAKLKQTKLDLSYSREYFRIGIENKNETYLN